MQKIKLFYKKLCTFYTFYGIIIMSGGYYSKEVKIMTDKITKELILLDEIVYGVEPVSYYDDGIRKIYKFIDDNNNVYIWKTSKSMGINFITENGDEGFEFINEGDKILLSGTIKDFNTFRGEDQIIITRCKILDIIQHNFIKNEDDLRGLKQKIQLAKYKDKYEIKTVKYKDYKNEYQEYETLIDSFVRNDKGCFIDIIVA